MQRIVVGMDGSEGATAALRWAAHEAGIHGASLTAVLAWTLLGQPPGRFAVDFDQQAAADTLDGWIADARVAPAVERSVVCDLPVSALVEASSSADLVVVGSRGLGGFKELLLGSVSAAVAERAVCPVAVVRESGTPTGPVVVGVDGSAPAHRALELAAVEARVRRESLEIVHVMAGGYTPAFGLPIVVPLAHAEQAAEHTLTEAMAKVDLSGVAVHRHVLEGTPAGALVELSRSASVVVVGSRGRGGLTSILLGSTSRHLLHHAACPVIVVR